MSEAALTNELAAVLVVSRGAVTTDEGRLIVNNGGRYTAIDLRVDCTGADGQIVASAGAPMIPAADQSEIRLGDDVHVRSSASTETRSFSDTPRRSSAPSGRSRSKGTSRSRERRSRWPRPAADSRRPSSAATKAPGGTSGHGVPSPVVAMKECPRCHGEIEGASFRFCPWCGSSQRRKRVEFFLGHPRIPGNRRKAVRVSAYLGSDDEQHVRISVWNESGAVEAAVSLDGAEARRLGQFVDEVSEDMPTESLDDTLQLV